MSEDFFTKIVLTIAGSSILFSIYAIKLLFSKERKKERKEKVVIKAFVYASFPIFIVGLILTIGFFLRQWIYGQGTDMDGLIGAFTISIMIPGSISAGLCALIFTSIWLFFTKNKIRKKYGIFFLTTSGIVIATLLIRHIVILSYEDNLYKYITDDVTTAIELEKLSENSFVLKRVYLLKTIIRQENISTSTLLKLATNENKEVRSTVAENPKTSEETIYLLLNDNEKSVVASALTSPYVTSDILLQYSQDPYYGYAIASNKNSPTEALQNVLKLNKYNWYISDSIFHHPNVSDELKEQIVLEYPQLDKTEYE